MEKRLNSNLLKASFLSIISKKRKSFRKNPVIQSVKNIMKNMKSLKRQFRNCMNTFRSMKDQQISSVNLYRKM